MGAGGVGRHQPKPNTVLLAVALNDGKLVVAVSGNSESWLYNKTTSDQLLKSAYGPVSGRNPTGPARRSP